MSARPECRKFSPNIFNKTKCTNCFRQKEEHTAEALESNRATRKVAKCGYLFVAPGWDFTNPLNRTKRWQRRWFMLHDDGELSYALDEHPETVPQASIDMNKVVEVANAEEITGNAFSLAITAPDHVHFVKGTSREEIRFWSDVLSVFPRSKGRHKRNATFPGTTQTSSHSLLQTPIRGGSNSKTVEAVCNQYNTRLSSDSSPLWEGDDVYPTRDTTLVSHTCVSSPSSLESDSNQRKVYMGSPPTRDKVDSIDKSSRLRRNTGGGVGNKRSVKSSGGRSYTEDLTKMMPWQEQSSPTIVQQTQGHPEVNRRLLLEEYESECKLKDIADSLTRPRNISPSLHEPTRDSDPHKQIRGDPDGCGLDVNLRYSPSDLRVELPSEDLLNIKKGWLMKQGQEKEWTKHWFVLRGSALLYYRDPTTEDQGILDGVIDLSGVTAVSEIQVQRNYGFQITTWDERRYVLSAVTSGIRTNWMSAVRKAAGLPQDTSPSQLSSPIQESSDGVVINTSVMPRLLLLSSDDEYRTASENGGAVGGRRESGEWGEALPPSPPLNRTPMSRVKERARGVSKLRVYGNNSKRSRSSPPSSRRSTLDSISSTDLIPTSLNNVHHSNGAVPSPPTDNKVASEMEEVKHELNLRLRELNSAQEELMRQRQRQADINHLEKLVEELSKRAEETGKQRARDAAELESLKKRFVEEKLAWEASGRAVETELEASAARCAALCSELGTARDTASTLASRLAELETRLDAARRENESLYARLTALDLKGSSPVPPTRSRSLDSLSDLTNIDLDIEDINQLDKDRLIEEYMDVRARFEKAVSEIRAMKRELREAHAQADWLELSLVSTRQEMKSRQDSSESSNNLMAARIQDLATKLVQSEKQIRTLKQKLSKTETREKRRSLSLKGRESFAISKEFEDKLFELESRVNSMEGKTSETPSVTRSSSSCREEKKSDGLSLRLRRKSLDSATASEPMKVLLRLNNLEAKISGRGSTADVPTKQPTELKLFSGDELDSRQSEIIDQVKKMENLLRAKLVVLAKKRESLMKNGQWNEEARLHLLAEKLAYESVLVGRLHDAITDSSSNVDTSDAERLIQGLDSKLSSRGRSSRSGVDTSLDYLVRELAKHLSQQSVKRINRKSTKQDRRKRDPALTDLVNKKAIVDAKVVNYMNETVGELAEALAIESLSESNRTNDSPGSKKYEETVWNLAREAVDRELVQEEIVRVMSDCTQQYQQTIEDESGSRFLGLVKDRSDLELWASTATEKLTTNMNEALIRINNEFIAKMSKVSQKGHESSTEILRRNRDRTRQMLSKLADIVAHKSLLDARLAVITSRESADASSDDQTTGLPPPEETSLLSEIQYLYVKFCRDLSQESKDKQKIELLIDRLSEEICRLETVLVQDSRHRLGEMTNLDTSGDLNDPWLDCVATKFQTMRERLCNMQKYAAIDCKDCDKCKQMHSEISRIEGQYSVKILNIERRQEEDMVRLKSEFDRQRDHLVRRHREEEDLLLKNNTELERELESLSTEYNDQLKNLKASTYDSGVSLASDLSGDSLHLRYQKEIQHLRAVCEKGLTGMENSHKRQIEELQEKHERELESLRMEKEQALAEETHATLAALDAMRKAHEAEVQKEIAKFKSEFLNKMQSNHDFNAIHKQHQAEMAEIKTEILSLSEKYSVKCVENASLEDKLRSANQQLAHAHQRMIHMDNRCKQMRSQLTNEGGSDTPPSPPLPRLNPQSHGEVLASARRPRVVDFIPKSITGGGGREANTEPRISRTNVEPPPLGKQEVKRCPEKFSLCGMVSKRREEFERLLAAPTTCTSTSRV